MNAHIKTEQEMPQEMPKVTKPYEFRELCSDDVFLMATIISKIGIQELSKSFNIEPIKKLIVKVTNGKKGEKLSEMISKEELAEIVSVIGFSIGFDMFNVLLTNMEKVKPEVYQLLSQTSNLSVEEIRKLKPMVFIGMLKDFFKKEDFADFFKGASSLLK